MERDDGLSSDDLLAEAKKGLGLDADTDASDTDAADTEAPGSSTSSIDDFVGDSSSSLLEEAEFNIDELSDSTYLQAEPEVDLLPTVDESPIPPPVAPPEEPDSIRFTIPDPGVPTGLPSEPVEVDSDEVLAGLPAPPEATAKAGGLLAAIGRNWWIIVAVIIGVSFLSGPLDDEKPISEVGMGECFDDPGFGDVAELKVIDCDEPHQLEAFGTVTFADGPFPGDDVIGEQAFLDCVQQFESYVGRPYETSALYAFPFTPTRSSWEDGDREALCVVYEEVPGSDGFEIATRTGSVRGSGL